MQEQQKPMRASIGRSIGAILIDEGILTPEGAEGILRLQKQKGLRFGEAAIELGLLTEKDIEFAVAKQFDYVYLSPNETNKPISEEVVAAYKPFSPQVEQLRALRSQLMLRWFNRDTDKQTALAILGADRGDGRSYLAANLAVVFSQLGERTLLIDADMRNPRQHQLFKLDNRQGLSTVLSGRGDNSCITPISALANLAVLPTGPTPPNAQELLSRAVFAQLLARASEKFDVILIDTPALSVGADASLVAMQVGAGLAVARKDKTRATAFQIMSNMLTQSGVTLVGSVLNASE
jgi:receptor protein-tyrosine kinase